MRHYSQTRLPPVELCKIRAILKLQLGWFLEYLIYTRKDEDIAVQTRLNSYAFSPVRVQSPATDVTYKWSAKLRMYDINKCLVTARDKDNAGCGDEIGKEKESCTWE